MGQSLKWTIAGEGGRGQSVERADALLQKLSRQLKNRLRKTVVEAQLVGAGGVVDNKLAGRYDRLTAILKHAVDAAVGERHQHVIGTGARDPRRGAQHPLGAGIDARAGHRPDRRLRDRAPKRVVHVGAAIEPDKDVADDVLPDRQPSIRN